MNDPGTVNREGLVRAHARGLVRVVLGVERALVDDVPEELGLRGRGKPFLGCEEEIKRKGFKEFPSYLG